MTVQGLNRVGYRGLGLLVNVKISYRELSSEWSPQWFGLFAIGGVQDSTDNIPSARRVHVQQVGVMCFLPVLRGDTGSRASHARRISLGSAAPTLSAVHGP